MLKAYFDDSGSHRDSDVVVIGGLVGNVEQWEEFERRWTRLLNAPLPGKPCLRRFHLSACNAKREEFESYSDAEQDAVMHDFRRILIDTDLISTASAIDRNAWNDLIVGAAREWLDDPINLCVENCIAETLRIANPHPDGDKIAVVLDRGIWTPRIKEITEEFTFLLARPRVVSVTFARVEDCLPLQGADIPATESYWHAIKVLREGMGAQPRAHLKHYLQHMRAEGLIVDRAHLAEALPQIEERARGWCAQRS